MFLSRVDVLAGSIGTRVGVDAPRVRTTYIFHEAALPAFIDGTV